MKKNARLLVFILVILAVGAIFLVPYLDPGKTIGEFTLTDKPGEKLSQALNSNKPIFLEFYSYT